MKRDIFSTAPVHFRNRQMQVFIFGKYIKEQDVPYVTETLAALESSGIAYKVFEPIYKQYSGYINKECDTFTGYQDFVNDKPDACITLGGDGTILAVMTHIRDNATPILGINLGRLGFLASIEKSKIKKTIQALGESKFKVQQRSMISLIEPSNLFADVSFALNDFTINKRDTSSMVTIHSYIDGEFLNSYWADGIIVTTPTGSTGYSLSCGGPIIFPGSGNFGVIPVAPHNLNVRPIVIPDNSELSFKIEGRSDSFLCTLDSRHQTIQANQEITIKRCDFNTNLLVSEEDSYMNTIRNKLYWGYDKRN